MQRTFPPLWSAVPLLMLPILAALFLTHLAFWPAQMSPDSIEQWSQIVAGSGVTDAHPALSFLLNWLPYQLVPSPAFVVAVQYCLFGFSVALLIWELGRDRLPFPVLAGIALISALFVPNLLIATTLWKDVL